MNFEDSLIKPFGPIGTMALVVAPRLTPVSLTTHTPSAGHSLLTAYTPGLGNAISFSGTDRLAPLTNPSAVPVIRALAGSWQPSGRTTSTAPFACGALAATGLPMVRKNPPASAHCAPARPTTAANPNRRTFQLRTNLGISFFRRR